MTIQIIRDQYNDIVTGNFCQYGSKKDSGGGNVGVCGANVNTLGAINEAILTSPSFGASTGYNLHINCVPYLVATLPTDPSESYLINQVLQTGANDLLGLSYSGDDVSGYEWTFYNKTNIRLIVDLLPRASVNMSISEQNNNPTVLMKQYDMIQFVLEPAL